MTASPSRVPLQPAGGGCVGPEEWTGLQRPRHLELQQLLDLLNVSPMASPAVLQVAQRAHAMPYPPHWSEEIDAASGAIYFYHMLRDEASWTHPLVGTFREVLSLVGRMATELPVISYVELAGRVEAALTDFQQRAARELEDWEGPLDSGSAVPHDPAHPEIRMFFYNRRTGASEWADPRERWLYELHVRYDLLVGFLVAVERGTVQAGGKPPEGLGNGLGGQMTPTLTSLASSIGSLASSIGSCELAVSSKNPLAAGDLTHSPPKTPRFGGLPLPPRVSSAGNDEKLFAVTPHQSRYAADVRKQMPAPTEAWAGKSSPVPAPQLPPPPPPPPSGASGGNFRFAAP
eukprot:gnl/TRDRNA2_/TRDRNA2_90367_c0_seq2.p1 gnl/TRDRNA2_/TRDRNA2_90367_c0~~gnl/TRDRNA2_/TRDRNA2_90367_c0_seq2.p1  ORF type:complete len:355 (+),score=55.28 gnl/TRDRNA2_/TRDRNA2_90367_c0_seq2:30-1067(+)